MKKVVKLLCIVFVLMLGSVTVQAASNTTLYVGQTKSLKLSGSKKGVVWTSSNKSIVSVNKKTGKIKALKKGSAVIKATYKGGSQKIKVTSKVCKHKYGNYKVTREATCSREGIKTATCKVCKVAKKTKKIKKVSHEVSDWEVIQESTCHEKGQKIGVCDVCGEEVTEKLPLSDTHSYKIASIKDATCKEEGVILEVCELCGKEKKTPTGKLSAHSWGSAEITTPATCAKTGVRTYTCKVCGEKKEEKLAKVAHVWDGGKITLEPKCISQGVKTYTCTACKATKEETVAAKGHTWKLMNTTVAAVCTKEGKGVYTCSVCNKMKEDVIPKTTHNYKAVITQPTCTTKGCTTYTCSICKDSYVDPDSYVNAIGHKYSLTSIVDPTTKALGYEVYTCSMCKNKENRNYCYYDPLKSMAFQSSVNTVSTSKDFANGAYFSPYAEYIWNGYGEGSAAGILDAKVGSMKSYNVPQTGVGSFAFAFKVSDSIFGSKCPAKKVTGNSGIQKGDIVVVMKDDKEYAYFVHDVTEDTLKVADGLSPVEIPIDPLKAVEVRWGVTINKSDVDYRITRYWD